MSTGSIKNRIQQNNTKLTNVIVTVNELPDYIDTSDATAIASDISAGKTAYADGVKLTGTGAVIYATETEMNLHRDLPENTMAIVYGTTYVGTFRLDHGSWTQIGTSTDEQLAMDNLNAVMNTTDEYEGLGGTEQQVNTILDDILGNNNE